MLLSPLFLRAKKSNTLTMSNDDLARAERDYKWLAIAITALAVGTIALTIGGAIAHEMYPIIEKKQETVHEVSQKRHKQNITYYINNHSIPDDILKQCSSSEKFTSLKALKGKKIELVLNTQLFEKIVSIHHLPSHQPLDLCR